MTITFKEKGTRLFIQQLHFEENEWTNYITDEDNNTYFKSDFKWMATENNNTYIGFHKFENFYIVVTN